MQRKSTSGVDSRLASPGTLFAFLAPAIVMYMLFMVYPAVKTFYNSVYAMNPRHAAEFVGLGNFVSLLTKDDVFWRAVRNTALFSLVGTLADVGGGLLLALCLFARVPLAPCP